MVTFTFSRFGVIRILLRELDFDTQTKLSIIITYITTVPTNNSLSRGPVSPISTPSGPRRFSFSGSAPPKTGATHDKTAKGIADRRIVTRLFRSSVTTPAHDPATVPHNPYDRYNRFNRRMSSRDPAASTVAPSGTTLPHETTPSTHQTRQLGGRPTGTGHFAASRARLRILTACFTRHRLTRSRTFFRCFGVISIRLTDVEP